MQSSQDQHVGLRLMPTNLGANNDTPRDIPLWMRDPTKFLLDWYSLNRAQLVRCTKEYTSELTRWRKCQKVGTASRLKGVLKRIMMFLYSHMAYVDNKNLMECEIEEELIMLVSMYVDMEMKVWLKKREELVASGTDPTILCQWERRIADRLSHWLYTSLTGHTQRVDALLSLHTVCTRHSRPVLDPVFRKVLSEMDSGPLADVSYVRHMLVYKVWRERVLVSEDEASRALCDSVVPNLVPVNNYSRFSAALRACLGKVPRNADNVARFHIMPNNINLRKACDDFLRCCRVPCDDINFGSISLIDDDFDEFSDSEEGDVKKLIKMISDGDKKLTQKQKEGEEQAIPVVDLTDESAEGEQPIDVIDLTEDDEESARCSSVPLPPAQSFKAHVPPRASRPCRLSGVAPSAGADFLSGEEDVYMKPNHINFIIMCPVRYGEGFRPVTLDEKLRQMCVGTAQRASSRVKAPDDCVHVAKSELYDLSKEDNGTFEPKRQEDLRPASVPTAVKWESPAVQCGAPPADPLRRDEDRDFCENLFSGSLTLCDNYGQRDTRYDSISARSNRTCPPHGTCANVSYVTRPPDHPVLNAASSGDVRDYLEHLPKFDDSRQDDPSVCPPKYLLDKRKTPDREPYQTTAETSRPKPDRLRPVDFAKLSRPHRNLDEICLFRDGPRSSTGTPDSDLYERLQSLEPPRLSPLYHRSRHDVFEDNSNSAICYRLAPVNSTNSPLRQSSAGPENVSRNSLPNEQELRIISTDQQQMENTSIRQEQSQPLHRIYTDTSQQDTADIYCGFGLSRISQDYTEQQTEHNPVTDEETSSTVIDLCASFSETLSCRPLYELTNQPSLENKSQTDTQSNSTIEVTKMYDEKSQSDDVSNDKTSETLSELLESTQLLSEDKLTVDEIKHNKSSVINEESGTAVEEQICETAHILTDKKLIELVVDQQQQLEVPIEETLFEEDSIVKDETIIKDETLINDETSVTNKTLINEEATVTVSLDTLDVSSSETNICTTEMLEMNGAEVAITSKELCDNSESNSGTQICVSEELKVTEPEEILKPRSDEFTSELRDNKEVIVSESQTTLDTKISNNETEHALVLNCAEFSSQNDAVCHEIHQGKETCVETVESLLAETLEISERSPSQTIEVIQPEENMTSVTENDENPTEEISGTTDIEYEGQIQNKEILISTDECAVTSNINSEIILNEDIANKTMDTIEKDDQSVISIVPEIKKLVEEISLQHENATASELQENIEKLNTPVIAVVPESSTEIILEQTDIIENEEVTEEIENIIPESEENIDKIHSLGTDFVEEFQVEEEIEKENEIINIQHLDIQNENSLLSNMNEDETHMVETVIECSEEIPFQEYHYKTESENIETSSTCDNEVLYIDTEENVENNITIITENDETSTGEITCEYEIQYERLVNDTEILLPSETEENIGGIIEFENVEETVDSKEERNENIADHTNNTHLEENKIQMAETVEDISSIEVQATTNIIDYNLETIEDTVEPEEDKCDETITTNIEEVHLETAESEIMEKVSPDDIPKSISNESDKSDTSVNLFVSVQEISVDQTTIINDESDNLQKLEKTLENTGKISEEPTNNDANTENVEMILQHAEEISGTNKHDNLKFTETVLACAEDITFKTIDNKEDKLETTKLDLKPAEENSADEMPILINNADILETQENVLETTKETLSDELSTTNDIDDSRENEIVINTESDVHISKDKPDEEDLKERIDDLNLQNELDATNESTINTSDVISDNVSSTNIFIQKEIGEGIIHPTDNQEINLIFENAVISQDVSVQEEICEEVLHDNGEISQTVAAISEEPTVAEMISAEKPVLLAETTEEQIITTLQNMEDSSLLTEVPMDKLTENVEQVSAVTVENKEELVREITSEEKQKDENLYESESMNSECRELVIDETSENEKGKVLVTEENENEPDITATFEEKVADTNLENEILIKESLQDTVMVTSETHLNILSAPQDDSVVKNKTLIEKPTVDNQIEIEEKKISTKLDSDELEVSDKQEDENLQAINKIETKNVNTADSDTAKIQKNTKKKSTKLKEISKNFIMDTPSLLELSHQTTYKETPKKPTRRPKMRIYRGTRIKRRKKKQPTQIQSASNIEKSKSKKQSIEDARKLVVLCEKLTDNDLSKLIKVETAIKQKQKATPVRQSLRRRGRLALNKTTIAEKPVTVQEELLQTKHKLEITDDPTTNIDKNATELQRLKDLTNIEAINSRSRSSIYTDNETQESVLAKNEVVEDQPPKSPETVYVKCEYSGNEPYEAVTQTYENDLSIDKKSHTDIYVSEAKIETDIFSSPEDVEACVQNIEIAPLEQMYKTESTSNENITEDNAKTCVSEIHTGGKLVQVKICEKVMEDFDQNLDSEYDETSNHGLIIDTDNEEMYSDLTNVEENIKEEKFSETTNLEKDEPNDAEKNEINVFENTNVKDDNNISVSSDVEKRNVIDVQKQIDDNIKFARENMETVEELMVADLVEVREDKEHFVVESSTLEHKFDEDTHLKLCYDNTLPGSGGHFYYEERVTDTSPTENYVIVKEVCEDACTNTAEVTYTDISKNKQFIVREYSAQKSEEIVIEEYAEEFIITEEKPEIVSVEPVLLAHRAPAELSYDIPEVLESCQIIVQETLEVYAKEGRAKCSVNGQHKDNKHVMIRQDGIPQKLAHLFGMYTEDLQIPAVEHCQAVETTTVNECTLEADQVAMDSFIGPQPKCLLNNISNGIPADDNFNLNVLANLAINLVHLDTGSDHCTGPPHYEDEEICLTISYPPHVPTSDKPVTHFATINENGQEDLNMLVQKLHAGTLPPKKGSLLENKIQALTEKATKQSQRSGGAGSGANGENVNDLLMSLETMLHDNNGPSDSTTQPTDAAIPMIIPNTAHLHLTPDDDDFIVSQASKKAAIQLHDTIYPLNIHPVYVPKSKHSKMDLFPVATNVPKDIYNEIASLAEEKASATKKNAEIKSDSREQVLDVKVMHSTKPKPKASKSKSASESKFLLSKFKSSYDQVIKQTDKISNARNCSSNASSYIRSTRPMRMVTTRKRKNSLSGPVDLPDISLVKKPSTEEVFDKLLEEHKRELSKNGEMNISNLEKTPPRRLSSDDGKMTPSSINSESTFGTPDSTIANNRRANTGYPEIAHDTSQSNVDTIHVSGIEPIVHKKIEAVISQEPPVNGEADVSSETIVDLDEKLHELDVSGAPTDIIEITFGTVPSVQHQVISKTDEHVDISDDTVTKSEETEVNIPEENVKKSEETLTSAEDNVIKTKEYVIDVEEIVIKADETGTETEEIVNKAEESRTKSIELITNDEPPREIEESETNAKRTASAVEVVEEWFNRVDNRHEPEPYAEIATYQTIEDCNFFEEGSNSSVSSHNASGESATRKSDEKVYSEHQTPDSGIAFDEDSVQKEKLNDSQITEQYNSTDTEPYYRTHSSDKYFSTLEETQDIQQEIQIGHVATDVTTSIIGQTVELKVSISLDKIKNILPMIDKKETLPCVKESTTDTNRVKKRNLAMKSDSSKNKKRKCSVSVEDSTSELGEKEWSSEEVMSPMPSHTLSVPTKGSKKEYPDCLFGISESPVPARTCCINSPYPSDISLQEAEPAFYVETAGIDLITEFPDQYYESFDSLKEQESLQASYTVDENRKEQQSLQAGYCVVDSQFTLPEHMNDGELISMIIENNLAMSIDKRMVAVNMHQVQPEMKPHNTDEAKRSEFDDYETDNNISGIVDGICRNLDSETVEYCQVDASEFVNQANSEVQLISMDQATSEVQVVIACDSYQDMDNVLGTYLFEESVPLQTEDTQPAYVASAAKTGATPTHEQNPLTEEAVTERADDKVIVDRTVLETTDTVVDSTGADINTNTVSERKAVVETMPPVAKQIVVSTVEPQEAAAKKPATSYSYLRAKNNKVSPEKMIEHKTVAVSEDLFAFLVNKEPDSKGANSCERGLSRFKITGNTTAQQLLQNNLKPLKTTEVKYDLVTGNITPVIRKARPAVQKHAQQPIVEKPSPVVDNPQPVVVKEEIEAVAEKPHPVQGKSTAENSYPIQEKVRSPVEQVIRPVLEKKTPIANSNQTRPVSEKALPGPPQPRPIIENRSILNEKPQKSQELFSMNVYSNGHRPKTRSLKDYSRAEPYQVPEMRTRRPKEMARPKEMPRPPDVKPQLHPPGHANNKSAVFVEQRKPAADREVSHLRSGYARYPTRPAGTSKKFPSARVVSEECVAKVAPHRTHRSEPVYHLQKTDGAYYEQFKNKAGHGVSTRRSHSDEKKWLSDQKLAALVEQANNFYSRNRPT